MDIGTHSWSMTQIFGNDYPSHDGDHKTYEVCDFKVITMNPWLGDGNVLVGTILLTFSVCCVVLLFCMLPVFLDCPYLTHQDIGKIYITGNITRTHNTDKQNINEK